MVVVAYTLTVTVAFFILYLRLTYFASRCECMLYCVVLFLMYVLRRLCDIHTFVSNRYGSDVFVIRPYNIVSSFEILINSEGEPATNSL